MTRWPRNNDGSLVDPHYLSALAKLPEPALSEYVESILAENGAARFAHLTDDELNAKMREHDWSRFDGRYDRLWDDGTEPLERAS